MQILAKVQLANGHGRVRAVQVLQQGDVFPTIHLFLPPPPMYLYTASPPMYLYIYCPLNFPINIITSTILRWMKKLSILRFFFSTNQT